MDAEVPLRPRRPLWQEIGLSVVFTVALVVFGAAATLVGERIMNTENGARVFPILCFMLVVPFLVYYAYPQARRRWYHWAGFELCAAAGFTVWIPLIYLPWLIVTRKAWRVA
jgi:hypothetical protein